MTKIKYKGKEYELDEQKEKDYGNLESDLKISWRVPVVAAVISLPLLIYGGNDTYQWYKSKKYLNANHPVEYSEYSDAEKRIKEFDKLFLIEGIGLYTYDTGMSNADNHPREHLLKKVYDEVLNLKEKDKQIRDKAKELRRGLEQELQIKAEPIKKQLEKTYLDGLSMLSSSAGITILGASVLLGPFSYFGARKRKKKFLERLER